jgi:predicted RND superfamily exporter protein
MLQSLFSSQITTLSLVLVILFVMFILLFRSLLLTLIALIVNIIPIGIIFGVMGWLHIPLDIMTITIAAIAMGIGVDDTIHYIHRFKE